MAHTPEVLRNLAGRYAEALDAGVGAHAAVQRVLPQDVLAVVAPGVRGGAQLGGDVCHSQDPTNSPATARRLDVAPADAQDQDVQS